jgi:hypothetical protein
VVYWLLAMDSAMLLRRDSRYDVAWLSISEGFMEMRRSVSSGKAHGCPFVGSAALATALAAGPVIVGAVRTLYRCELGWYAFGNLGAESLSELDTLSPGFRCCCRLLCMEVVDWLLLA